MTDLNKYPPFEQWHDWTELDAKAWPKKVERKYTLVPTSCFNCEAGCGLIAYFDQETGEIAKVEGNPEHPASCLLYTSPSPRDGLLSRMPSSA